MKNNNKYIKSISLSMALIVASPTISSASNLNDFVMSTTTSAGSWTDPLAGSTYMSGGSFKMKLKSTSRAAPWFQFRQPSIKVGCSGIDLQGGFLAFLGLDKLQDQFADAGASLMMGILIGIEFTMPAISAVFNKIRAWANALQAMLQNSCNIGQAIAKSGKLAKAFHIDDMNDAIEKPFDEMNDWMSGGDDMLQGIKDLGECDGTTELGACGKKLKHAVNALGRQIKENKKSGSDSSHISKKTMKPGDKKEIVKVFKLKDFYDDGKITGCTNATTISLTATDVLIDQLKYVFFGELGNDEKSISNLEERIDDEKCLMKAANLAKDLAKSITTGASSDVPIPSFSKIPALIGSKDAAYALIYGFDQIKDRYGDLIIDGDNILIPNRKIVYMDLPIGMDDDGYSTSRVRVTYTSNTQELGLTASLHWGGAYKDSLKGIRQLVDNQTGHFWRLATNEEIYDTSAVTRINTPLLLPSVLKYVSIISRLEKKAKGETQKTRDLKVTLAKINAITFSEELISAMKTKVLIADATKDGNVDVIQAYTENIETISNDIREILKVLRKDLFKEDLFKSFKGIETEMNLNSIKTLR